MGVPLQNQFLFWDLKLYRPLQTIKMAFSNEVAVHLIKSALIKTIKHKVFDSTTKKTPRWSKDGTHSLETAWGRYGNHIEGDILQKYKLKFK